MKIEHTITLENSEIISVRMNEDSGYVELDFPAKNLNIDEGEADELVRAIAVSFGWVFTKAIKP